MIIASAPLELFDRMTALADPVRSRVLLLLEKHELTVNELKSVLQLPQSTVSRHLKLLGDQGWVTSRAEGTSRLYRLEDSLDASSRRLWQLVREQVAATAAASHDSRRLKSVLSHRRSRSEKFFSSAAGQWDHLRVELFGKRADLSGLLGLLDDTWIVGDLGCGTGQLAEMIAPFVSRVIAIDDSPAMLDAAQARLRSIPNVDVRTGRLESLPIEDGALDAALLVLVMHYIPEPEAALAEACRALKPGGRLLVVDMMPHDREDLIRDMGHVWRGFSEKHIANLFDGAGFAGVRYHPLPADEAAKGPSLFAAIGRRASMPAINADATGDPGSRLVLTA